MFGSHPNYKFVFVNHVTTNPFFTPTQYGAADACKLLGCSYQWTGSENSNVAQMVNALNSGVTSGADGIAVALIDLHAFNAPVEAAHQGGHPGSRLQRRRGRERAPRLHRPGPETGRRKDGRTDRRRVGSGEVGLFIATPGSANLQPRIEGAEKAIKASGKAITAHTVATGAAVARSELGDRSAGTRATKARRACTRSTAAAPKASRKSCRSSASPSKGVNAGGFDLTEQTQKLLKEGNIEFTIDQQPYLQGFHAGAGAVPVQGLRDADGPRRSRHGPEVPEQRNGRARTSIRRAALRGHVLGSEGGPDPGRYERA